MATVTYYWNSFTNAAAWTDPEQAVDGSIYIPNTHSYAEISGGSLDTYDMDANTCQGTDLGTITSVQFRFFIEEESGNATDFNVETTGYGPSDITIEANFGPDWKGYYTASGVTTWAGVKAMDLNFITESGNPADLKLFKAEILVTYTPVASIATYYYDSAGTVDTRPELGWPSPPYGWYGPWIPRAVNGSTSGSSNACFCSSLVEDDFDFEFDGNTCPGTDLGPITDVEVRVNLSTDSDEYPDEATQVTLTSTGLSETFYPPNHLGTVNVWTHWYLLTGSFTWAQIPTLSTTVTALMREIYPPDPPDPGYWGQLLVAQVEIRVLYTPYPIIPLTQELDLTLHAPTVSIVDVANNTISPPVLTMDTEIAGSPNVAITLNLTGVDWLCFDFYASRLGSNVRIDMHDTGGNTFSYTPEVRTVNEWTSFYWNISGVADVDKDEIDTITLVIINDDAPNDFYIENLISCVVTAAAVSVEEQLAISVNAPSILSGVTVFPATQELIIQPLAPSMTLPLTLTVNAVNINITEIRNASLAITATLEAPAIFVSAVQNATLPLGLTLNAPTIHVNKTIYHQGFRMVLVGPGLGPTPHWNTITLVKYIKDPIASGGCPQCGTFLYPKKGRDMPTEMVTIGRNFENAKDDTYIRCGRCGFLVKRSRHPAMPDRSRAGWGINYTEVEAGESDISYP